MGRSFGNTPFIKTFADCRAALICSRPTQIGTGRKTSYAVFWLAYLGASRVVPT